MKRILSFLIVLMLIISSSTMGFSQVMKDETVYVKLNHDGSSDSIMVVSHLSGTSTEEFFIDYGEYKNLQPLVTGVEPIIEQGIVKWPTEILKEKDIYYQGEVESQLPMKININYYLDDVEVKAEELLGKSGKMKIAISIKESEYFTTQIQIPLSLKRFSNIEAKDGVKALVGKTMTVAFNHLPMGDSEFILEAYGKDIELESFVISATIMNVTLPGDIGGDLDKLSEGIGDLSIAATELSKGSSELSTGSSKLRNGLKSLSSGISQLFKGLKDIDRNTKEVSKGFSQFNTGLLTLKDQLNGLTTGVGQMNTGLNSIGSQGTNISNGLQQLNGATKELKTGLSAVSSGLGELNTGHDQLVLLAQSLQAHPDPSVQALAQGVIGEAAGIKNLANSTTAISSGFNQISENLNKTALGYVEYNNGLTSIVGGFNEFSEGIKSMPAGIDSMYAGHLELTQGLEALSNGISTTTNGMKALDSQTNNLPNEVSKIVDGQNKITNGLNQINEEGLKEIKTSINDFNNMGIETPDAEYTSFVNSKNEMARTGFIMNTPAVSKDKSEIQNNIPAVEKDKRSIFERFLNLFKK